MSLTTGARLGPYEVVTQLGAGGMGEVYRARDTRLGRDVAIKVLPTAFAADADRLARFEQEARAAAALNHPNILAVHDIGQHSGAPFIVTELLDGMSLREVLHGSALPARKAIDYSVAIAQGLAAAHEKGIVHRDLKPENVFVTADGRVKILDFGVAKLTQPDTPRAGLTVLPTTPALNAALETVPGMVVGTIGYMSPEQVRGGVADPRSDIFSLGVLMHEMLSGRRPFSGDTAADVMSSILREDPPDLSGPERHISPALARIVNRCLEKSPPARFQSARDLAFALEGGTVPTGSTAAVIAAPAPTSPGRVIPLAVAVPAAVLIALLAGGIAWLLRPIPSADAPVVRLSLTLPPGTTMGAPETPSLAISADGRNVAYVASHAGVPLLMLRALDSDTAQTLSGTEGALGPFFSPDGKALAFFARGRLRTITLGSLETRELSDAPTARGGSWADDGFIYYAPRGDSEIMKVPADGSAAAVAVTTLDRSKGEISHRWPQVLPGGKAMLFTVWVGPARDNHFVQVYQFDTKARHTVAPGGNTGRYVRSGHIVFGRLDALVAVPFDLERLTVTGPAVRTGESVRIGNEGATFAVSDRGDLIHLTGDPRRMDARIVWVDRSGRVEPVSLPAQDFVNVRMSPDNRRAAFNARGATDDITIFDFARGSVTALTSNTTGSQAPVWSPDGRRIAYRGTRKGYRNIWVKPVDGTGDEVQLTRGEYVQTPMSWSPDGKYLLYHESNPATGLDLWALSVADGKAEPLAKLPQGQFAAEWSPDGRWIAYASGESGRSEIFVMPFPATGQRWPVSTEGGAEPLWSHDGRELFYRGGGQLMAVDVRTSPGFSAGAPRRLFADRFVESPTAVTGYSMTRDGSKFLFAERLQPDPPLTSVHVVMNWFAELRAAAGK